LSEDYDSIKPKVPEYVKAFVYLDATNIDVLYIDKREEELQMKLF
jgi:hypothetical protein